MPVPTKIGMHRDRVKWPIQGESLTTRDPITSDRSDEVYRFLQRRLNENGVATVDLQSLYRSKLAADPLLPLYATNDSHWAGEGIRIAAVATAEKIAATSPLVKREPVDPTYLDVDHVGDLAKAFDPMPGLTTWLTPAWRFKDRLVNGESGRGYTVCGDAGGPGRHYHQLFGPVHLA